jgi:glucose-6-phosphate isomerase
LNNFFVVFIEVLKDRQGNSLEVEPGVHSGDFLNGFYLGTRQALFENDRQSISLTLSEVTPFSIGLLIALFERAVGLYASLININAYHQPGVEAGKKAASAVIELQWKVAETLKALGSAGGTVNGIAAKIGRQDDIETIFKVCEHLAANPSSGFSKSAGASPFDSVYRKA